MRAGGGGVGSLVAASQKEQSVNETVEAPAAPGSLFLCQSVLCCILLLHSISAIALAAHCGPGGPG